MLKIGVRKRKLLLKKNKKKVLFKSTVEEEKRITGLNSLGQKFFSKAHESRGAAAQGITALVERGDKIETIGNKTANLHVSAFQYAQLAKQLKEKNGTKSKLSHWF